jgi:hypothetical protein
MATAVTAGDSVQRQWDVRDSPWSFELAGILLLKSLDPGLTTRHQAQTKIRRSQNQRHVI